MFQVFDPLDVWLRVTVLAEKYKEPSSSLHQFIKEAGLPLRWRGTIPYTNERAYQDALESLPTERPNSGERTTPLRRVKRNSVEQPKKAKRTPPGGRKIVYMDD